MAAFPSSTALTRLDPELKRYSPASLATEKSPGITFQRSSVSTKLDGGLVPIRPLEFREALSLIQGSENMEPSIYLPLLQECLDKRSLSETHIIHAHMMKTGTQEDFFVMTFLVNVYAKCGDMACARKVFDNLPRRNVVAWTSLITGYAQNSEPAVAIEVFQHMLESGSFPSNFTLGIALHACSSLHSIELGKQLHAFIIKYKIDHDSSIGNALCCLYSKFGGLESAVKAFERIGEKEVISWTSVISACGENGKAARGLRFFNEMILQNIEPNQYTLTCVLGLCCAMLYLNLGTQVHGLSYKLGYESNLRIRNSILYLYLKCGCIDIAQRLFNRMEYVNLVTWNAMIAGHTQAMDLSRDNLSAQQSGTEALSIYLKLNRSGVKPDMFTLSSILTVCGKLLALEQGEQIHAQTIKSGFPSDVIVGTALITMYNKCGSIERGTNAFLEMPTRTMISWTTMITSLAQHGQPQQALQLFEDMRISGVRPNQITFVGVLAACSHARMVNEALGYFEMMQKDYKIKPVMDHYSCLVNLFVKLGRLDDAFDVVKKMNFEASEFIWSLLIAGCRNHGNEELGFYAAEQLLKLIPKDMETYVMLLNMYISAERWEDVSRVRELMREQELEKLTDLSRISIRDKVYSFETSEQLHPDHNAEICTNSWMNCMTKRRVSDMSWKEVWRLSLRKKRKHSLLQFTIAKSWLWHSGC